MGVRHGAARCVASLLAGMLALLLAAGVRAAEPGDYLAMVLNGRLVGSAFLIADGVAVTNRHVVGGGDAGGAVTLIAASGRRGRVRVLAVSRRMDLAILAAPPGFFHRVPDGDAAVVAGLAVRGAGVDAGGPAWPGPRREVGGAVLAADAAVPGFGRGLIVRLPGVRPGFSGSALFDEAGRLVGMVTAIRSVAAAGGPGRRGAGLEDEAFVLPAPAIRAEVRRLLGRIPPNSAGAVN